MDKENGVFMDDNIFKIDVGIGLADSELASYCYSDEDKKLTIRIRTWNTKIIAFEFSDFILFLDRGSQDITEFCRNANEIDLFKEALVKTYEKIP